MTDHMIVDREEWEAAREELLQREKEHTRMADELARRRRELPWVAVEKEYETYATTVARGRVPDALLPDPRPGAEGPRRGRGVPDLDSPPRRVRVVQVQAGGGGSS
jgi:Bacterial protein of unknown function (DUF899)